MHTIDVKDSEHRCDLYICVDVKDSEQSMVKSTVLVKDREQQSHVLR